MSRFVRRSGKNATPGDSAPEPPAPGPTAGLRRSRGGGHVPDAGDVTSRRVRPQAEWLLLEPLDLPLELLAPVARPPRVAGNEEIAQAVAPRVVVGFVHLGSKIEEPAPQQRPVLVDPSSTQAGGLNLVLVLVHIHVVGSLPRRQPVSIAPASVAGLRARHRVGTSGRRRTFGAGRSSSGRRRSRRTSGRAHHPGGAGGRLARHAR